jgi:hypothetical protein
MGKLARLVAFSLALGMGAAILTRAPAARADDMDVTLARLRVPAVSGTDCSPTTADGPRGWCPDNGAWTRIMSQLGASMAPPILAPARTVGPGGFHIGFDTWVTGIDADERYWQLGTEGDAAGATERCGPDGVVGCNRFVNQALTWSRLRVRKGFPFGFELGASIGHAFSTEYWTWGAGLSWALFEGFRTGAWAYVPDVAVRAQVQTLTGASQFNLTVPSLELVVSKPIVAGGVATLTPFASGQMVWILADSEVVDLSPGRSAVSECRPLTPAEVARRNEMNLDDPNRSTVICAGDPSDFNNSAVFDDVRALRARLAFGLEFRYQLFTLSGSFLFDVSPPGQVDGDASFEDAPSLPRQWTVAFGVGLQL